MKKGNNISYRPPISAEDFKRYGCDSMTELLDKALKDYINNYNSSLKMSKDLIEKLSDSIEQLEIYRDFDAENYTEDDAELYSILNLCHQLIIRTKVAKNPVNLVEVNEEGETYDRFPWAYDANKDIETVFEQWKDKYK